MLSLGSEVLETGYKKENDEVKGDWEWANWADLFFWNEFAQVSSVNCWLLLVVSTLGLFLGKRLSNTLAVTQQGSQSTYKSIYLIGCHIPTLGSSSMQSFCFQVSSCILDTLYALVAVVAIAFSNIARVEINAAGYTSLWSRYTIESNRLYYGYLDLLHMQTDTSSFDIIFFRFECKSPRQKRAQMGAVYSQIQL